MPDEPGRMTREEFVRVLLDAVPEFGPTYDDSDGNPAEDGQLLIHLVMFDLLTFTEAHYERGEVDLVRRCLGVVERGLLEGDDRLQNAVSVSFVEDAGPSFPETQAFLALWPASLLAEAARTLDTGS